MYHVSAQGVDERMINVHYYYYLHQPGNSVCVGKDTSKQNIQNMKANVKSKQQKLSNKYSNHVVYL